MTARSSLAALEPGIVYRAGDYFDPVALPFEEILVAAERARWTYPRIRVALGGYFVHPMHFTTFERSFDADPLSAVTATRWQALRTLYADGAVVILDHVEAVLDALAAAVARIRAETGRGAQCNAYFTNGRSFAFKRHADLNDILVVQAQGSKTWQVTLEGRDVELVMKPGDLIRVPKNVAHRVAPAPGVESAHVSITLDD